MRVTASCLVSEIIERLEGEPVKRGRPRLPVSDVVATVQFFLREGVQWRALPASDGRASGSTLRRRLRESRAIALLPRVHAVLLRLARSDPETAAGVRDVIVDSCSVRAKHGGELTGPNPTDRGKRGTKYHMVVSADGLPLGAVASAANVHDTKMFPELLRLALVVGAKIARLFAPLSRLRRRRCRGKGCRGPQRRQPLALFARGHSAPHPQDRLRARLRPWRRPLGRRER